MIPHQQKHVSKMVGFASKGLGCMLTQCTKKSNKKSSANVLALVEVQKGAASEDELEKVFTRVFQHWGAWE